MSLGLFASNRWEAAEEKTLLVYRGQVPIRDGRVCYAGPQVAGAEALEAITFAKRARAICVDSLPEATVLAALGGAPGLRACSCSSCSSCQRPRMR